MRRIPIFIFLFSILLLVLSCNGQTAQVAVESPETKVGMPIIVGAENTEAYYTLLQGKKIGMVVNQTSRIGSQSIVDTLISAGMDVVRIFSPEHGFRGEADAGAQVENGKDIQTGLPIVSLYGKNKKPTSEQFAGLDLIVFDIQDVGARFYTYISTMHYVMQTCAEIGIPLMILDRPNPNGNFVDGPIMEEEHMSFVGMHPIPIVHGMTVGEYAKMINGEGWLGKGLQCALTIVKCENYTHQRSYTLPVKPSPNLPNNLSIYLYPSICLFEGTAVSVGRGTDKQFQVLGYPDSGIGAFTFVPEPKSGATNPKYIGEECRGYDLSDSNAEKERKGNEISLQYLIDFYSDAKDKSTFFISYFTSLAGTENLQQQIEQGMSEQQIKATWEDGLIQFRKMRGKYLIYGE